MHPSPSPRDNIADNSLSPPQYRQGSQGPYLKYFRVRLHITDYNLLFIFPSAWFDSWHIVLRRENSAPSTPIHAVLKQAPGHPCTSPGFAAITSTHRPVELTRRRAEPEGLHCPCGTTFGIDQPQTPGAPTHSSSLSFFFQQHHCTHVFSLELTPLPPKQRRSGTSQELSRKLKKILKNYIIIIKKNKKKLKAVTFPPLLASCGTPADSRASRALEAPWVEAPRSSAPPNAVFYPLYHPDLSIFNYI